MGEHLLTLHTLCVEQRRVFRFELLCSETCLSFSFLLFFVRERADVLFCCLGHQDSPFCILQSIAQLRIRIRYWNLLVFLPVVPIVQYQCYYSDLVHGSNTIREVQYLFSVSFFPLSQYLKERVEARMQQLKASQSLFLQTDINLLHVSLFKKLVSLRLCPARRALNHHEKLEFFVGYKLCDNSWLHLRRLVGGKLLVESISFSVGHSKLHL